MNAIRDGIRQAGATSLTVRCLALSPAPAPTGDRRGDRILDGQRLWDTSDLPGPVQDAIQAAGEELFGHPEDRDGNIESQRLVNARRGTDESIDNAMSAASTLGRNIPDNRRAQHERVGDGRKPPSLQRKPTPNSGRSRREPPRNALRNATETAATAKRQEPRGAAPRRRVTTRARQGDKGPMEWNRMQVTITNEDGEIFAEHELGPLAASQLHEFIDHAKDSIQEDDEHVVHDLVHSLESAADNVRLGAVTDDNNLIVSETG